MHRRWSLVAAAAAAAIFGVAVAWMVVAWVSRPGDSSGPAAGPAQSGAPAAAADARKITATLYYISEDGMSLVGIQREIPFGEPIAEQARLIVEAQLGQAPAPLAPAIPDGTTLRGVYLTEQGDVFVDLSEEARTRHKGGALDELFTIYAIVDALTVNLPSVARVQILVNGREEDTLAGHVDLRHPLEKNLTWVRTEKDE